MTSAVIQRLCKFLPAPEDDVLPNHFWRSNTRAGDDDEDPELDTFLMAYKDMAFGSHFVKTLAANKIQFPACAYSSEDRFLWRAYLYYTDKKAYRDPAIIGAVALSRSTPEAAYKRAVINALLVSADVTPDQISRALAGAVSADVVEAYATLFFDVPGRKDDTLLLAAMIYPHGRYAEFMKDSVDNEAFDKLLQRAGYNNGVDDVLAIAGIRSDYITRNQTGDAAKRLEMLMMTYGWLLARNGGLSSSGPLIHNARAILTAAKQSGQEGNQSPFTASMGRAMMNEIDLMRRGHSTALNSASLFGGQNAGVAHSDMALIHQLTSGEATRN